MGSLDDRLPKTIMMNTAVLKEKLSAKIFSQPGNTATTAEIDAVHGFSTQSLPSMTLNLVLTIPVSVAEASVQIERILRLLATAAPQCSAQYHLLPALATSLPSNSPAGQHAKVTAATQTSSTAISFQTADGALKTKPEPAGQSKPGQNRLHREPSTDKQQQLLQRLAIRQRLSADVIKQLLVNKFGVESGAQLSKSQASELINVWIGR